VETAHPIPRFLSRYWIPLAALGLLILVLPFFTPLGMFLWNYQGFRELLHERIGLGESASAAAAVLLTFMYVMALPLAAGWLLLGQAATFSQLLALARETSKQCEGSLRPVRRP
jgi:hypothetical protein